MSGRDIGRPIVIRPFLSLPKLNSFILDGSSISGTDLFIFQVGRLPALVRITNAPLNGRLLQDDNVASMWTIFEAVRSLHLLNVSLDRTALRRLQGRPFRVPDDCQLDLDYFECPLPDWSLVCFQNRSDACIDVKGQPPRVVAAPHVPPQLPPPALPPYLAVDECVNGFQFAGLRSAHCPSDYSLKTCNSACGIFSCPPAIVPSDPEIQTFECEALFIDQFSKAAIYVPRELGLITVDLYFADPLYVDAAIFGELLILSFAFFLILFSRHAKYGNHHKN